MGNLLAVWTSWQWTSVYGATYTATVADGTGSIDTFYNAVGPTVQSATTPNPTSAQMFYAKSIASGTTSVAVTFTAPAPPVGSGDPNATLSAASVVVVEYTGLDLTNPLDSASAGYSSLTNPTSLLDSGNVAPANSNLTILAVGIIDQNISTLLTPGSGFGSFQSVHGPGGTAIAEDNSSAIAGNNVLQRATACTAITCPAATVGNWIMQMAAFRDASWTVQGGSSPSRTATVLYVDQFPGSDIGMQANNACSNLPAGGGTLIFPPGIFRFSTTITNCNKTVIFKGAGAGTPPFPASNPLVGTDLVYTGSGEAIVLTGNSVAPWLKDLAIDNQCAGTVAIDFGGASGAQCCLNHAGLDNVSVYPTSTCFSTAEVVVGPNGNDVVGAIIDNSYLRCDGLTPPVLLQTELINEVIDVNDTAFTGGPIKIGSSVSTTTSFHMRGGGIGPAVGTNGVTLVNVNKASFTDVAFEIGQSCTMPGYMGCPDSGYAIDCSSSASGCLGVSVSGGFVSGVGDPVHTTWVFDLNNANSDLTVENMFFIEFPSPAHVLRERSTARASLSHNTLDSSGMDMTNAGVGGPVCLFDNYSPATPAFLSDFPCSPITTFSGNVAIASGATLQVGGGSSINLILRIAGASLNSAFTSISPGTCQDQTITLTGATTSGVAVANPAASLETGSGGLALSSWVSATNTINVRLCNIRAPGSSSITPNSVGWNAPVTE
ncbi:MAG: hypothetical protein ACLPOO_21880 [Terriglobales bacterium]